MNKIVVLWATLRSTSTAFEWMMRMRGDMICYHEPFCEVWYQGESPLWPRWEPTSPRTPGLTYESRWAEIQAAAQERPVFSKDFAHAIEPILSDDFLAQFTHSFLIRDPAKVLTGMYRHWKDFVLKEVGTVDQRLLFDRLADKAGMIPPVIDSDDLLENPHGIVEAYCKAVDIPFIPEALSWEPGSRREVSYYDEGSWHNNLRQSDGLKKQPRKSIDISEAPDFVKEMYDIILPDYEYMHTYRLGRIPKNN